MLGRGDVCLVTMPYAALPRPSLALGLLKQTLTEAGVAATVAYANLWFAERVGVRLYHLCSHGFPSEFLAGEWTFREAAFGPNRAHDNTYLDAVEKAHHRVRSHAGRGDGERLVADLYMLREAANCFIDEAARRVIATGARLVGCTSTFEQHVASLALLRRVRQIDPTIVTLLGGANCEAEMGRATHRCFPWVDFVVSGEADGLIADLCRLLLAAGRNVDRAALPFGVFGPQPAPHAPLAAVDAPRAEFRRLDALAIPDFSDYFAQLQGTTVGARIVPGLPLETSRGCWWGELHHCTFCGLNGNGMAYRSKSPDRVVDEIHALEQRYGITRFEAVDNILDFRYFTTVLPRLAEDGVERRLFYEVKANLTRAQVGAMRDAGITWAQPGIESLHTDVLKLMDKGVQGWQNVQLLKWAREAGIRLTWGVLWGFPGEQDVWYEQMAAWIPALEHLQPPATGLIRLRYDRFSVYHRSAQDRGLDLVPISAMSLVYPVGDDDLSELTYFFAAKGDVDLFASGHNDGTKFEGRPGTAQVLACLRVWQQAWQDVPPLLTMNDRDGVLEMYDSRSFAGEPARRTLTAVERAVCLACDDALPAADLPAKVAADFGLHATQHEVDRAVEDLIARRVLLPIDRRLITLALRREPAQLPAPDQFPGGFIRASTERSVPAAST